ncbi:PQQ-dependent sugar dehydrogenase [Schlesneria paludicola]|uniref:PQQ-dependent sugar dehydrogenase n=1 Tax=Schlesneria paludicola TaxID=360056 RepID=UPI00029A896E|nr:PQQ-dependent sugar dehydrogenase [Schlesneria paludicola]
MLSDRLLRCFPHVVVLWQIACLAQCGWTEDRKSELPKRAPWTTSRITGSPDPQYPYVTEQAFPRLKIDFCLDLAAMPGSDRLFVMDQFGKIVSFPNRDDVDNADLVVDLKKDVPGLEYAYSIVFHPDFERNRYLYVCYIQAPELPDGTHIARFQVSETNPPTIDPKTETTIITWLSGGHNGCHLKFGPEGFLYISTGDGSGANPPDKLRTGQDLSDLLSSILRIDVDHPELGRNYRIPADNPFVETPGARGEIWAYGLRNPWRMSFDRKTGDLWVGDVGWELWEMLDRIERGGNYGWAVLEGRMATHPEWPRGPTPILPPTIDLSHDESSSITDGLTYYGTRLKELYGTHIYSDYDTGRFWGFRYENGKVVDHRELADTTHRVVGIGEDHSGEFFILDHTAGTIHRLIPNPLKDQPITFPRKLSESGLFSSLEPLTPATGVVSYSVNAEPWSDYATAERHLAIPDSGTITPSAPHWKYPKDSVFVKTLSLPTAGNGSKALQRIETQILHFDGAEWMPYTYQWNDEQTDATLLNAVGSERRLKVDDPSSPGQLRQQSWRFASRAECQRCHNKWSGPVLGFSPVQLEHSTDYRGTGPSQFESLIQSGFIVKPETPSAFPALVNPRDVSADLMARARAYLQVNCAHCHRLHAGGAVLSHMHHDLPLEKTNMIGVRPTQGTFGIHAAQVIAPGDPFRSVLYYRMSKQGNGRMPHLGSSELDHEGIALIHDWIHQLPRDLAKPAIGDDIAVNLRREESSQLQRLCQVSASHDPISVANQLLSSTSGALMLLRAIDQRQLPSSLVAIVVDAGAKHPESTVRDLFERFLPPEQRIKRIGTAANPKQILALTGDADNGKRFFFEATGVSCKNCHRVQTEGKQVGPDLTTIGKKLSRPEILESILEPSKRIDPKFVTYLAELDDGRLLTGLLVHQDDQEVVLKDAQDKVVKIPVKTIEQLVPQGQSLMPDSLFRDMTAQQLADLVEYLSHLK